MDNVKESTIPKMTDEEATEILKDFIFGNFEITKKQREAISVAIEKLES